MILINLRHISKANSIKEIYIVSVINTFPGNLKEKAYIEQDAVNTSR